MVTVIVLGGHASALGQAGNPEAQVPIHGVVVSVNRGTSSVVLRYTRPGSQPATKHAFGLANHNDVLRLHARAVIDATADMTRKPWLLSNVNVESDRPLKGDSVP